ncbi:glycosyltransferase family A protein [Streptomyces natalensis]|uniref:Glycosyltransferase 2-like domain-containing protein n=1 Tax=Streptomyces natalensis ATCC 27448 TaxID=1240678 RepID=A0A0D7CHM3_9ACTN|nr:glycosyltransferase family A protein [Streptomyces natalensis]KIZ15744.1 hypothetical protein SNA_25115 [Streptomyces natalensis ATCC 27448]
MEFGRWPPGTVVERTPVHGGVSAARNRALNLSPDGWIYPLDGDDTLDIDGLVDLVCEPAVEEGGIGWVSANRAFLDGTPSRHHCASPCRWARHELAPAWTLPAFPFHPNAVLARTDAALAAGGWPAIICCEDIGWALAMSELFAGASTPHVVTRYRTWPNQVTHQDWFDQECRTTYATVTRMANARRRALGQPAAEFPEPPKNYSAESTTHRTPSATTSSGSSA